MNKHVEEAMKLRNATPMCNNCAQTILRVYAEEMGMSEDLAAAVGSNFGSGMRCGGTCGAITAAFQAYRRKMAENHDGMTDCADLLRANAEKGGEKKTHCDNMIKESIEVMDEVMNQA